MKSILLMGLPLLFFVGCASGPPTSASPTRIYLPYQQTYAGDGAFVFTEVLMNGSLLPGSWVITGIVRNNTGWNWKQAVFDFELYDEMGSPLSSQLGGNITFTTDSLAEGEVLPFSTNYFKPSLKPEELRAVWKYKVAYKAEGSRQQISKGADSVKHRFIMIKPWESQELLFEDQSIRITFSPSEKQIGMLIQNKTLSPIKVDWNNISYVDIAGLAHGVMHTGIRYMERDRPQVPTVIPPAAMIEDVIVPSDHISYTSGTGGGWSSRPLFPGIITETDRYIGKSFSVFMPLEFDGAIKNYLFSFRIERAE
jgi:hypothetical protein